MIKSTITDAAMLEDTQAFQHGNIALPSQSLQGKAPKLNVVYYNVDTSMTKDEGNNIEMLDGQCVKPITVGYKFKLN